MDSGIRFFTIYIAGLMMSFSISCIAQTDDKRSVDELFKGLTLEDNLHVLNMWGEQSAQVNELYRQVFSILEQKPNGSFADVSLHIGFRELCSKYGVVHLGGPMLGNVTTDGAMVWVRTVKPSKVEVRLQSEGRELVFGPVKSTEESDLVAIVPVKGLKPDTGYPYRVYVDGTPANNSVKSVLTTLSASEKVAGVRIAVGTCFHRLGLGNHDLIRQILFRKPMAMLLGGDIAVQDRIFNFIEKNRIGGVILISGDRHGARGFRIPRPSGFSFYEFESASLGGRSGPYVTDPSWDTQLYGFAGIYAFGEFSFNTTIPNPQVTFRLIQDDGTVLYQITITRNQLTPSQPEDRKINN